MVQVAGVTGVVRGLPSGSRCSSKGLRRARVTGLLPGPRGSWAGAGPGTPHGVCLSGPTRLSSSLVPGSTQRAEGAAVRAECAGMSGHWAPEPSPVECGEPVPHWRYGGLLPHLGSGGVTPHYLQIPAATFCLQDWGSHPSVRHWAWSSGVAALPRALLIPPWMGSG